VKVIAYLRVSTDEQADSGLGLAAQRAAITHAATLRGWDVTWVEDAGYSAKNLDRPGIQAALRSLAKGEADALVVAKLDRLSRSLLDFAGVTEQAKKQGWAVVAIDLGVDMTTPAGEMLANVLASFAQYERALISRRTKDALAAAKARGQRLGRPRQIDPPLLARVVADRERGLSLRAIAQALNDEAVPTVRGWPLLAPRHDPRSLAERCPGRGCVILSGRAVQATRHADDVASAHQILQVHGDAVVVLVRATTLPQRLDDLPDLHRGRRTFEDRLDRAGLVHGRQVLLDRCHVVRDYLWTQRQPQRVALSLKPGDTCP
jgi:DNA invertase Pin-like site-specific DNA recombinase